MRNSTIMELEDTCINGYLISLLAGHKMLSSKESHQKVHRLLVGYPRDQTRLFADDCIVYRTVRSHEDCLSLQQDLYRLAKWELKWGMEFHPQKCSVLSVTRSRSLIKHLYKLKGHILEVQDCTKYLGVDLQLSMSWKNHIDRITKKANSTLGFLRRNLKAGSEETKSNAYFCMVRSNLKYCCSVWSPHHKIRSRRWK